MTDLEKFTQGKVLYKNDEGNYVLEITVEQHELDTLKEAKKILDGLYKHDYCQCVNDEGNYADVDDILAAIDVINFILENPEMKW